MTIKIPFPLLSLALLALGGCGMFGSDTKIEEPKNSQLSLFENRGSLLGGESDNISLTGSKDKDASNGPGLGVNSFLWRATLDTLGFMPLTSADPFGGVILTDWYEDPRAKGERYKVNALILDKTLRADGIKITLFKQRLDGRGVWRDTEVPHNAARDLEDTILTRAREMRVAQSGK